MPKRRNCYRRCKPGRATVKVDERVCGICEKIRVKKDGMILRVNCGIMIV